MKRIFYYSDKSLKFLEIKHFKAKVFTLFIASTLLVSSLIFGVYYIISSAYSTSDKAALENTNELLKKQLIELSDKYNALTEEISQLSNQGEKLRVAVNLSPLSNDEKSIGTGGSRFDNELELLLADDYDLNKSLNLMDDIIRKFEFEKNQYDEINSQLKSNKDLFESMPAILPTNGNYSVDGFGMRVHPILKVYKMHDGLDILTDVGSPVFAPGKGKVDFVGRKGGYGLAIEIDHGFGFKTIYAHLSKSLVKEGQKINRGDKIGLSGNSGLSSGPHLHYEVHHNGVPQDPINYFYDDFNYFEAKKITNLSGEK